MTDENPADLCKDCGPTFRAFLEGMAGHNQEQMELNAKVTCPTCGKVHEYTFPYPPKAPIPPAPLRDETNFCSEPNPQCGGEKTNSVR